MGKWLSAFWGRFRHRADHLSLTLALGLSALSVLCIYAIYVAGYCKDRPWQIQALATGLGFCAVVVMVGLFDYESLAGLWRFYYPLTAVVMIYTAFFGETRPGSDNRSWLDLGVTSIQPSEVWKLAFILTFAWHLAKVREDLNHPRVLIPVLLNAGVGVGVVLLQKDTGVALVLAAIVVAMLFVAGLSRKLILGAMGVGVDSVPVVWFRLLSDFQKERILSLFDPQQFVETTAMQQLEGLDSLGSGQVFGIGLFAENHNYVPEMYNDFIFTFIGESFGFVGCVDALDRGGEPQLRWEVHLHRNLRHAGVPDHRQYRNVPDGPSGHRDHPPLPLLRRDLGAVRLPQLGPGYAGPRKQ